MDSSQIRKFMNLFEHVEVSYKKNTDEINPNVTIVMKNFIQDMQSDPKIESRNVISLDSDKALNRFGNKDKILKFFRDSIGLGPQCVEELKEENGRLYYEFKEYADKIEKVVNPKVHTYNMPSRYVYDITQTDDNIKDGDILVVDHLEETVIAILREAWPTAITSYVGAFDTLMPDVSWQTLENGKYIESYNLAMKIKREMGVA